MARAGRRHMAVALTLCGVGSVTWSAPPAIAAGPTVVVNELYYNPADDNPDSEFVELFNTSGAPVDLSAWCIGGVSYCFPAGSVIAAGGFLVVTGAQYDGALSNGGEKITLTDVAKATVESLTYDDVGSWPALADGDGHSLQRRDPLSAANNPGNWISDLPTPGAQNRNTGGVLPSFSTVKHTVLPAEGAPIEVTAKLANATTATLHYRIGLGGETPVTMTVSGGSATATIPGQAAGSLVRYRLDSGNDVGIGTWPRQGDGSVYAGTTVARPATSQLPTFELFMDDATYTAMFNDLTLTGDDGYPMTFAFAGQVFDNARIRVKGQASRTFPKKKFKIILPAGHELEHELFPETIDEFAVHSNWIDRSFLRETLASEFMQSADVRGTQQAFPIRLERNGGFYGLYTYVEQPDGTWRDRWALDDSEVYEVSPDMVWGLLSPTDATRSQASLRARYDKETFEYLDDQHLRDLIWVVNQLSGAAERDWLYANADLASMVNAIAASMVMQHQDWGHKNYRLVFDQYGRVGITTNDFDLTFGRRWSMELGPYDTRVYAGGWFEQPGGPLFETFFYDPALAEMVERRIRTLAEENFQPDLLAARVNQLATLVRPDALSDRFVWGTYGGSADPTAEATRLLDSFVRPQHSRLLGTLANAGRVARTSQPAIPAIAISQVRYDPVEHVALINRSGDSVDLSGFEIPELDLRIPGGTVLLPGQQVVFVHEDVDRLAERYPGLLLGGVFEESLADAPHGFTLVNRQGTTVVRHTLTAPRQLTEFGADAGRSALVSLVATETAGPGFLQVLDCDAPPATTSNLNVDGPAQTRAVLTLTRFDAAGKACVYNHPATHIVADLQGYLAAGAVDDIDDQRLIDTRSGAKPAAGAIVRVVGGRPDTTGIVSLVATETDAAGHFSIVDCAAPAADPATSNLNYDRPGKTVASLTLARFDASGAFCVYVHRPAHIVADLQGYLAAGAFDDVVDTRLVDTRIDGTPLAQSTIQLRGRPETTGVVSIVATQTSAPGWLQVLPCGTTPGATSNLNVDGPGITVNGLATVRFDASGSACVYTLTPTRIVVDLQGYFTAGAFEDVPDQRLLDTRNR